MQDAKNVTRQFDAVGADPRVRFLGNVTLGKDVQLQELRGMFDAVGLESGGKAGATGVPGVTLQECGDVFFQLQELRGMFDAVGLESGEKAGATGVPGLQELRGIFDAVGLESGGKAGATGVPGVTLQECGDVFFQLQGLPGIHDAAGAPGWVSPPVGAQRIAHPYRMQVVLAYGAEADRKLGVPGEDARNVLSARNFVW
eukprot:365753-Chlamydomonas_euryale.AAC.3